MSICFSKFTRKSTITLFCKITITTRISLVSPLDTLLKRRERVILYLQIKKIKYPELTIFTFFEAQIITEKSGILKTLKFVYELFLFRFNRSPKKYHKSRCFLTFVPFYCCI